MKTKRNVRELINRWEQPRELECAGRVPRQARRLETVMLLLLLLLIIIIIIIILIIIMIMIIIIAIRIIIIIMRIMIMIIMIMMIIMIIILLLIINLSRPFPAARRRIESCPLQLTACRKPNSCPSVDI